MENYETVKANVVFVYPCASEATKQRSSGGF